jgi:hypothetical protein
MHGEIRGELSTLTLTILDWKLIRTSYFADISQTAIKLVELCKRVKVKLFM